MWRREARKEKKRRKRTLIKQKKKQTDEGPWAVKKIV